MLLVCRRVLLLPAGVRARRRLRGAGDVFEREIDAERVEERVDARLVESVEERVDARLVEREAETEAEAEAEGGSGADDLFSRRLSIAFRSP